MAARVFIPVPASPIVKITTDPPSRDRFIVETAPEWYLFLSRRLNSVTLLLDGADFGVDQNIVSNKIFQAHVPMPVMTTNGDGILAGQIFGG